MNKRAILAAFIIAVVMVVTGASYGLAESLGGEEDTGTGYAKNIELEPIKASQWGEAVLTSDESAICQWNVSSDFDKWIYIQAAPNYQTGPVLIKLYGSADNGKTLEYRDFTILPAHDHGVRMRVHHNAMTQIILTGSTLNAGDEVQVTWVVEAVV